MEPIDLTCANCNATWKLIKAEGTIACPYCKAILDSPTLISSSAPAVPAPAPSELPVAAEKPTETSATNEATPVPASVPVAPTDVDPIPSLARPSRHSVDDGDDPGLRADYDDRYEVRRHSGMHPLLRVFIILMILFILVPLAVVILVLVVCAVMVAGR